MVKEKHESSVSGYSPNKGALDQFLELLTTPTSVGALEGKLTNELESSDYISDGVLSNYTGNIQDAPATAAESDLEMDYESRLMRLSKIRKDLNPYSISERLEFAKCYEDLFYPDLAAGEAYKALLLIDQYEDEDEYCTEVATALSEERAQNDLGPADMKDSENVEREFQLMCASLSREAHLLLVHNLSACGCLRSACEISLQMLKKHPSLRSHSVPQAVFAQLKDWCAIQRLTFDLEGLRAAPDAGTVRREVYPWNDFELDRYSEDSLKTLNEWMKQFAPNLEVKTVELPLLSPDESVSSETSKQLGVFALQDLLPGSTVLIEKSFLTATSGLNEAYCEACGVRLTQLSSTASSTVGPVSCESCLEAVFCSQTCHDLAQTSYHQALCDKDLSALAKDVPAAEAADGLYFLLLLRSLAMSECQGRSPLHLKEVKYIWGDFQFEDVATNFSRGSQDAFGGCRRTLPFSFKYNVVLPLTALEKMDVNIFETGDRYSTWVLNTLYAKFRGTASARQGPSGKPEVGAVHPVWCLANHSCDPNVTWEWEGDMKLWVKESRAQWVGKSTAEKTAPGIRRGQEILNHYCDINLDVQNRREWAVGALGGLCQCDRCVWEAGEASEIAE